MKRILFISALDYKTRSIQVNRLTPEHYVRRGWQAEAVICRDGSAFGDYYYEPVVDPVGVTVHRKEATLSRFAERLPSFPRRALRKLDVAFNVASLARRALRAHRRAPFDVIYGYEVQGALAAYLVSRWIGSSQVKVITRFQGSHLYEHFERRQWSEVFRKAEHVLAMMLSADLTIMTNDGTRGDKLLSLLKISRKRPVKFWPNGVMPAKCFAPQTLLVSGTLRSLSISRLVAWKRVERVLHIIAAIRKLRPELPLDHLVVGEGTERAHLESLSGELGISDVVRFAGALEHERALEEYSKRPLFLSMYSGSNAGNPLFEAIRHHCIVVTLANGGTGEWVQHEVNGLAYSDDAVPAERVATDILGVVDDPKRLARMTDAIALVERTRLWTWDERLGAEVDEVERLIETGHGGPLLRST